MLPGIQNTLSVLESLVGIKSDCGSGLNPLFFIEQIEGMDIQKLSAITNIQSPSAKEFARDIIKMAAQEMLGDLEMLLNSGYTLRETFGEQCSSCEFITAYMNGGGVKILNLIGSKYAVLKISKIEILSNYTGETNLIIDDKKEIKSYPVNIEAGVIMPILLNYQTNNRSAKISLSESSAGLAKINCADNASGCGCGSKVANNIITYSGHINGNDFGSQYGFKVCANVSCSNEELVNEMIRSTPNIFGLTLFYKVGSKIYSESSKTIRNNRYAGMDEEQKISMQEYYSRLYKERLNGTRQAKGISNVVGKFLQRKNDKCVICDKPINHAWAIG